MSYTIDLLMLDELHSDPLVQRGTIVKKEQARLLLHLLTEKELYIFPFVVVVLPS